MLKKMCLRHEKHVPDSVWRKVFSFLEQKSKTEIPKQSETFSRSDLEAFRAWLGNNDEDVQIRAMIVVAFSGEIRAKENCSLQWSDFTFHQDPKEVVVRVNRTKTNINGRSYIINHPPYVKILENYRERMEISKEGIVGPLYRCWNKKGQRHPT